MKISTRTHGVIDYVVGILLIAAPWLFGFANGGPEQWVPVVLGISTIMYSFFTRYELGVVKALPMSAHLGIDAISGVFLAASPWIFGFADRVYLPHLIFGIMEILVVMISSSKPGTLHNDATHRTASGMHRSTAAHS